MSKTTSKSDMEGVPASKNVAILKTRAPCVLDQRAVHGFLVRRLCMWATRTWLFLFRWPLVVGHTHHAKKLSDTQARLQVNLHNCRKVLISFWFSVLCYGTRSEYSSTEPCNVFPQFSDSVRGNLPRKTPFDEIQSEGQWSKPRERNFHKKQSKARGKKFEKRQQPARARKSWVNTTMGVFRSAKSW